MALKGRRSESLSPGANQYWPLIAPLDDPQIAGFVARLEEINSLADNAPGFVWRLQTEEGDATNLRPFDDEQIIVNLSVWESLEQLKDFVFKSAHNEVLKQRRQWFEKFAGVFAALWWIEAGQVPTIKEAKERLAHLAQYGATESAFTFQKPFPPPETNQ
jgi:heme-degrading monooxygenase HmoA